MGSLLEIHLCPIITALIKTMEGVPYELDHYFNL